MDKMYVRTMQNFYMIQTDRKNDVLCRENILLTLWGASNYDLIRRNSCKIADKKKGFLIKLEKRKRSIVDRTRKCEVQLMKRLSKNTKVF